MMLGRFVIKRSKDQAQLQSALQKIYSELEVVSESVISSAVKRIYKFIKTVYASQ